MAANPYESPADVGEKKQSFLVASVIRAGYFKFYRLMALILSFSVIALSLFLSQAPKYLNRDTYVLYLYLMIFTMLGFLLLPFRVLYLLVRCRFEQAAIDAVLVVVIFLAIWWAETLIGISV